MRHHQALRTFLLLLLLLLGKTVVAYAEWPYDEDSGRRGVRTAVELGPRAGYDYDGDAYSAGGQLRIPLWRRSRFVLAPSGDIYNDGTRADWQANVDLLMSPGPRGGLYAGLGFGWLEDGSAQRERAVNQLVGLTRPLGQGAGHAYLEARWTELNRKTIFRLVFGINLALFSY
ncbi:MAG: hypothetical protein O2782_04290 [bacterium]|nr:hypothetical protein [bacterium]